MAYYIYNGIKLPALPSGLNEFNYILRSGDFYYLASATAEEKTINAYGTIRVSSSEGIFYTFSDGAWIENSNDNAIGYVVWSNTDVYDSTGTLYIAATDPIPVGKPITDPLSYMAGYNWMKAMLAKRKRKPIGYLYGGVQLPELPEWDKETYPYAVITKAYITEYNRTLIFAESKPFYNGEQTVFEVGTKHLHYTMTSEGAWQFQGEKTWSNGGLGIIWSNTNVLYEDGTTYMQGTDPVPVYE